MEDKGLRQRNQQREVSRRATPVAQERNPTAPRSPTRPHADTCPPQPPATSHQPPATSHQPPATSHQPPATSHQRVSYLPSSSMSALSTVSSATSPFMESPSNSIQPSLKP